MCERQRVQQAFHRGAIEYDQHTPVQQRVVERLLGVLQEQPFQQHLQLLDIGCGTGRLLKLLAHELPQARLTGLDLAPNMLQQARERLEDQVCLIQGDAEQLPFADQTFDLVVSSSTFQWLTQLDRCFDEVIRVLKPGGRFVFSLFGQGTLGELQLAWRTALADCRRIDTVRQQDGTHRFHTDEQVATALAAAGFLCSRTWVEQEVVWYSDVPQLLQAVKRIGAGTSRPPVGGGLGWRRVLHDMAAVYRERFGTADGVPTTYQVIYGEGIR